MAYTHILYIDFVLTRCSFSLKLTSDKLVFRTSNCLNGLTSYFPCFAFDRAYLRTVHRETISRKEGKNLQSKELILESIRGT